MGKNTAFRRGRRAQRGAAAVFAGVALVAMLISAGLAINIGQLYYAQRDLQKKAVLAAMAGAETASGCITGGIPAPLATVSSSVLSSIKLNNGGNPDAAAALMTGIAGAAAVQVGTVDNQGGISIFRALPDGDTRITAVRVNLSRPQPAPLLPLFFGSSNGKLYASATAQQPAIGTFTVGTTLANLNTASSPLLNPLLQALLCFDPTSTTCQSGVNLSLADYKGLVQANVSLGNLLAGATDLGLNVTDLSQLLDLQLTLPQWLGVLGHGLSYVVNQTGTQVGGGVSGLVEGLAGIADSSNTFSLRSILNLTGQTLNPVVSDTLGAVPFVNGLDLLAALGQAAKADPSGKLKPIVLPLTVDVGKLLNVNLFLQVLQPPQFAIGPATGHPAQWSGDSAYANCGTGGYTCAQSSQIRVLLRAGINDVVLGLFKLRLGVDINVAAAAAYLDQLECPSSQHASPIAHISAAPSVAVIAAGPFGGEPENAKNAPPILNIPGNPSATSPYLLELLPNQGLLGWLVNTGLGWLLGTSTTDVSLKNPVLTPLGNPAFRSLSNIDSFHLQDPTQTTGGAYKPVVYTADGADGNAVGDNPQTLPSQGLLHSAVGNLLASLACGSTSGSCSPTAPSNLLVSNPNWQKNSAGILQAIIKGLAQLLNGAVLPLLNGVVDILNFLLSPLLSVLDSIVDGLLQLLGVQVGSATITMYSARIDRPAIVTTALPTGP